MKISAFLNDNLPVSKGSVQIPIRGLIDSYHKRYVTQRMIKKTKFDYTVYRIKGTDEVVIHVKVPSDTVPGFTYDVLYEITYGASTTKLEDCDVRIFSNSPSFVYTYAYIFYHLNLEGETKPGMLINRLTRKIPKDRMMIPGTEKKLPNEVRSKAPVVRNTLGLPLWDKSLYYGIFYLTEEVSFLTIRTKQVEITEKGLLAQVRDFDELMAERKREERAYREKTKTVRKAVNKKIRKSEVEVKKMNRLVPTVKPVKASQPKKPSGTKSTKRATSTKK